MTMIEAIRDAHAVAMERDDRVVVFGEDVGYFGGVFRCTQGLQERFGKTAASTPRSTSRASSAPRSAWRPTACGRASRSSSPTTCIPAYDQIVSEAARLRYRSAGDFTAPLVVRMPTGGGIFGGQTHSQSPEALFTHVCRPEDGDPVEPVRRQGLADRRDRGRRPGDLPRAEAAVQRPVRRPPRPAGRARGRKHPLGEVPTGTTPCRSARRGSIAPGRS